MSTVEEITAAIQQLPADDVARIRAWLAEFTEQLWDLRANPRHPSLHFKKVGRLWSVRAAAGYRALAAEAPDGLIWFWIGPHDEYERLLATPSCTAGP